MRSDDSGVVNISDERVPSARESDAIEPFTPEERVRIPVSETATSERFWGRKNPPEPFAESEYELMVKKSAPERYRTMVDDAFGSHVADWIPGTVLLLVRVFVFALARYE